MSTRDSASTGAWSLLASRVFDGARMHHDAAVVVEADRVVRVMPQDEVGRDIARTVLPPGTLLTPGLIDLQVNGGGDVLLNDQPTAEGMRHIARAHLLFGTTRLLPTLITDTRETMARAIAAAASAVGRDGILGLHLEGPFLSPRRPGIHRPDLITRPTADNLALLAPLGRVGRSMITLAPEVVPKGFIASLVGMGLRVSAGHSEASAAEMAGAVDEGLNGVTHLYNAMPPLAGRAPGVVGAAFAEPRVVAGLIVDGLHVDPISVRAAFAAKSGDGIALVSDAMPTVGGTATAFDLMGRRITLAEGRLTGPDGTLAGAHLDLAGAVRIAVQTCGIPLELALHAATATPARFLGLEGELGILSAGARADMVAFDESLTALATWRDGIVTT